MKNATTFTNFLNTSQNLLTNVCVAYNFRSPTRHKTNKLIKIFAN